MLEMDFFSRQSSTFNKQFLIEFFHSNIQILGLNFSIFKKYFTSDHVS